MTTPAASEQAFQTLMQMQIMQECPEGLARAHLFLSIWPKATRDQVLAAARDDNFGKELPLEVILANRQDIGLGLISSPPDLPAPSSPPGSARKRPRPARGGKSKPIGGVPGDSSALTVSASAASSSYLTSSPSSDSLPLVPKTPEPKPEGTRRAPQICQKCHQPRKGHTCTALNGVNSGNGSTHQSGGLTNSGSGGSIASGKTNHLPTPIDFSPVPLDYPPHLTQHLMSIPPESFTHSFMPPEYLSFDSALAYPTDPLGAQLSLDPSKRLRTD